MNKRLIEFGILSFTIIFTRAFDLVATYIYTPNLKKEANPLTSIFGLGWAAIILTQLAIIALILYFTYYNIFKPVNIIPNERKLNFKQFISYIYSGTLKNWTWWNLLHKFPKGKQRLRYIYGWVIPRAVILLGILIIIMHILIHFSPTYKKIHNYFVGPIYFIVISCFPLCFYLFFKKEYKQYKLLDNQSAH